MTGVPENPPLVIRQKTKPVMGPRAREAARDGINGSVAMLRTQQGMLLDLLYSDASSEDTAVAARVIEGIIATSVHAGDIDRLALMLKPTE